MPRGRFPQLAWSAVLGTFLVAPVGGDAATGQRISHEASRSSPAWLRKRPGCSW